MKKIFACLVAIALLLSMSALFVSAEEVPDWISIHMCDEAVYMIGDAEDFSPLGDVEIQWDPDASDKLDLADSDMQDWIDAEYEYTVIDASNIIAWRGDESTFASDWSISTYFVADSEWLYIGFYVTDSTFTYGDVDTYNGDAFQVCIDFGGKLGAVLDEQPDFLENPKNIFYSFSCVEDGAPLQILRQESDNDRTLTEENGDGVMGTAYKTSTGWNAEFALSWQMLYEDYVWKAWEDPSIYIGSEENLPLTIGCSLFYLDREAPTVDGEDNTLLWAGGTMNGRFSKDDGTLMVTYTAYDNGANLYLPYAEGMEFACEHLVVLGPNEGIPDSSYITTAKPTETTTAEPQDDETTVEPQDDVTTAGGDANQGSVGGNDSQSGGCASTVGISAAAVLVMAIAAAFVFKKKD